MKAEMIEQDLRKKIVGKFLRERRVKAGLTQMEVAQELRYSTAQFISNWERGISMPPMETLPKLSNMMKIPPRDFIDVMSKYQEQVLKLNKKELLGLFKTR